MLADCLTKDDPKAGDYLRHVVTTGQLSLINDPEIDKILNEQRGRYKANRKAFTTQSTGKDVRTLRSRPT